MVLGSVLITIGIISIIFYSHIENSSYTIRLDSLQTINTSINSIKDGIAFYKLTVQNYHDGMIVVQIIDPNSNVVDNKKIKTKQSINYFDLIYDGKYVISITGVDELNYVKLDFGKINLPVIYSSLVIIIAGAILIFVRFFYTITTQKIIHPELKT